GDVAKPQVHEEERGEGEAEGQEGREQAFVFEGGGVEGDEAEHEAAAEVRGAAVAGPDLPAELERETGGPAEGGAAHRGEIEAIAHRCPTVICAWGGSPKARVFSTRRKPARSTRLHISSREKKANWPSSASMTRNAALLRKWRTSVTKVA